MRMDVQGSPPKDCPPGCPDFRTIGSDCPLVARSSLKPRPGHPPTRSRRRPACVAQRRRQPVAPRRRLRLSRRSPRRTRPRPHRRRTPAHHPHPQRTGPSASRCRLPGQNSQLVHHQPRRRLRHRREPPPEEQRRRPSRLHTPRPGPGPTQPRGLHPTPRRPNHLTRCAAPPHLHSRGQTVHQEPRGHSHSTLPRC